MWGISIKKAIEVKFGVLYVLFVLVSRSQPLPLGKGLAEGRAGYARLLLASYPGFRDRKESLVRG